MRSQKRSILKACQYWQERIHRDPGAARYSERYDIAR
jgi:hypothetical protein